jgi:hypothetical protein
MDCFGFAAARLVQAAYEGLQLRHEMDLYAVKTVQLAANIAKDPELVAERFADLRTTQ